MSKIKAMSLLRNATSSRKSFDVRPKVWLVRKRLNVMQTWWRVLVIDPQSMCLINKVPASIHDAHTHTRKHTHTVQHSVPVLSQEEMLEGKATERKRLKIDSILQVISHS